MSVDFAASKDDVIAVEAAIILLLEEVNGIPIIDDNNIVIGMVTTLDLLRVVRDGKNIENMLARDIMTKNPLVVTQDTKVEDIIDIMDKQGIEMVPVVDEQANKRLIGIVSRSDILMEKISKELYNMK